MSTTFYNTFSITISYGQNFGAYLCTGKPNQFPMAPPAGSDSGLRPPQGQSRFQNATATTILFIRNTIGYGES